eukprot:TRINITY_DN45235_c0_g1_i1.p1 TRINITY_DN45235_c0_g1~~TRINITY_DN45235_c0_g1_i1.p1  ORF type:complete len:655 (+),score=120.89 TRINITY_DN45235_c0_g1_i1:153-1967(+)
MDHATESSFARFFAEEPLHGVAPDDVSIKACQHITYNFGHDVQQLGFRICWRGERPTIEKVDDGGAASQHGIAEKDVLLAINGLDTFGRTRQELLPMLKIRPLQLQLEGSPADLDDTLRHVLPGSEMRPSSEALTDKCSERPVCSWQLDKAFLPPTQDEQSDPGLLQCAARVLEQFEKMSNPALRQIVQCLVRSLTWLDGVKEPARGGRVFDFLYSSCFEICSFSVIAIHAMFATALANFEITRDGEEPPPLFQSAEMCFLCFYVFELILRGMVHRLYFFVNDQASWNIFDLFLIVTSAVDVSFSMFADQAAGANVSFMRVFRIFKIGKVVRTIRVIRHFKELRVILESISMCALSMFWGLLMLVFFLYISALVIAQGVAGCVQDKCLSGEPYEEMMAAFGSIAHIMLSLYMAVTGGNDWGGYYTFAQQLGDMYSFFFLFYTFFFLFALFNIMTGIFVESAMSAAMPCRDEIIVEERRRRRSQVENFRELCKRLDDDGSGTISKSELMTHMQDPILYGYMISLGIELKDVDDFFKCIGGGSQEVNIDDFVEGCMTVKGVAMALDVQKHKFETKQISKRVGKIEKDIRLILDGMSGLQFFTRTQL